MRSGGVMIHHMDLRFAAAPGMPVSASRCEESRPRLHHPDTSSADDPNNFDLFS
jgi:hypothetical protein